MSSQKIYEASTLLSSMNERIKDFQNLKEQLEELKAAFQEIVHLDNFKGKAADAIKGFYRAQIDVVNAWDDFLEQHIQFLKSVEGSVTDRNLSGNTLVHMDLTNMDDLDQILPWSTTLPVSCISFKKLPK